MQDFPLLKGRTLFRKDETVYVNRSDELQEYCSRMHRHDFIEIACVISGLGRHIVGEKEYATARGDLFVINYDVPHGFFPREGEANPPVVYNCVFMPQFLDLSLFSANYFEEIASSFLFKSLFPEEPFPQPDLKLGGSDFQEVSYLFEKMHLEYKQMKKGYVDMIRAVVIELIVKIFRYREESAGESSLEKNHGLIKKATEYMRQNYKSEITLSDLAMQSFISKNYFSRLFKEVTGTNVSDYMHYLRTDQACELLRTTSMKVTDIAMETGFNDIKFFYEVFKRITGKTPGEYRKTGT